MSYTLFFCPSVQQVVSLYYATAAKNQTNDCAKFELNVTLSQGKLLNVWRSILLPSFGSAEQPLVLFLRLALVYSIHQEGPKPT